MEYAIGLGLAVAVFLGSQAVGLTRDRAFFAIAMIVIAAYYVLFATMAASPDIVAIETGVALVFAAVAVVGFRYNQWLVALALAGHGAFDAVHHLFIANPGVPTWWPGFCGTYDVVFAACMAAMLLLERRRASPPGKQTAA